MNMEKKYKLKETLLPWNSEEDIIVYSAKLHKEQERLENPALTGMTHKKSHRRSTKFTPVHCLTRKI